MWGGHQRPTQAYRPQIFFYLIFISIFEFTDGCEMMHKA